MRTVRREINVFDKRRRKRGPVRKWSPEDYRVLNELLCDGTEWEVIAEKLNRTVDAVRKCASRIGTKNNLPRKKQRDDLFITRNWTADDHAILKREWLAGTSIKQIAQMLDRSPQAVRIMRNKTGLPTRYAKYDVRPEIQEMYEAGYPIKQIASQANVTANTLTRSLNRNRYRSDLNDDEKQIIEERHADGCSASCIARRLRRHHSTISRYIKDAELEDDSQPLDDLVSELMASGLTAYQVAAKLELPPFSITMALKRIRSKNYG